MLLFASCMGRPYPERAYHEALELLDSHQGTGGLRHDVLENLEGRWETAAGWYTEGRLESAEEHLYTAATLVTSDHVEHLILARRIGVRATELGEERGYIVCAMATDKLLVEQGEPQRYGTQIVYEPVIGKWRLYAVDPLTTDEERAAMGVPPLSELLANVERQNQSPITEKLHQRVKLPELPAELEGGERAPDPAH